LIEDYGFPPLTPDVKQATLSGNIARILGLDLPAIQQTIACDEFAQRNKLAAPWSGAAVAPRA
ncbi:MAG TPA: amidohydrolase, partial [Candidatus Tectomicrobia bacterium]